MPFKVKPLEINQPRKASNTPRSSIVLIYVIATNKKKNSSAYSRNVLLIAVCTLWFSPPRACTSAIRIQMMPAAARTGLDLRKCIVSSRITSTYAPKNISIDNLLNHRSGIHNFTNNPDYLSWAGLPKSEAELVEIISKGGSDFEPNSKAEYSNSNYVLLTFILEIS